MNKSELVDEIAKVMGATKADANRFLGAFTEVITISLKKGHQVPISGIGILKVVARAGRDGVNPQTGAKIKIPPANVPKLTVAKALKEAVQR